MGKVIFICFFAAGILLQSLAAFALDGSNDSRAKCGELIGECFGYDDPERGNCFYASATHPFCQATPLGDLSYNRWSLSPTKEPGPPALLGPQLVDGTCISNFDSEWFGNLTAKHYSDELVEALAAKLESCKQKEPVELPRP